MLDVIDCWDKIIFRPSIVVCIVKHSTFITRCSSASNKGNVTKILQSQYLVWCFSWCHFISLSQHHTDNVLIKCGSAGNSNNVITFFLYDLTFALFIAKFGLEDLPDMMMKNGMHKHIVYGTPTSDRHINWVHLLWNAKEHHTLYSSNWTFLPWSKNWRFPLSPSLHLGPFSRSISHSLERLLSTWLSFTCKTYAVKLFRTFFVIFFTSIPRVQFQRGFKY